MKVLAICGSPRKGNTEFALGKFLQGCKKAGAKTELILLRKKKMKMFDESSEKLDKDMKPIVKKMIDSDLLVFGIPAFYSMPPAIFKNFIDKTGALYFEKPLKNKKVLLIAIGQEKAKKGSSIDVCSRNMRIFCRDLGMKVISEIKIGGVYGPKDLAKNKKAVAKLGALGKKTVLKLRKK